MTLRRARAESALHRIASELGLDSLDPETMQVRCRHVSSEAIEALRSRAAHVRLLLGLLERLHRGHVFYFCGMRLEEHAPHCPYAAALERVML